MGYQLWAAGALVIFYGVYLGKMLCQKKQGIKTDQMGRGDKPRKVLLTERVMKIATFTVVAVEVFSVAAGWSQLPRAAKMAGAVLAAVGDGIFVLAVWQMQDSWRAGIAERDKTAMVTDGIYGFSRNPAFLGFDLLYVGILLMFGNGLLLAATVWAMVMLHLQILQEEQFLTTAFGRAYLSYQQEVNRYWGRRRTR